MSFNLSSLRTKVTIRTTKQNFEEYFKFLLPFLQTSNTVQISYVAFHNYFYLCSFITTKIYNLFTRLREPQLKVITQDICIEGFYLLFCSDFKNRAKIVFNLLDFDNDGYINIEDAKLLFSHFHYLRNKTDVREVYELIESFFNFSGEENTKMSLSIYENIITHKNSDFVLLLFFYLFENKPFQEQEIKYFRNKKKLISSEKKRDNKSFFNLEFAEPSEWIFHYLQQNFKIRINYRKTSLVDDDKELDDLIYLEDELSKVKNITMDLENKLLKEEVSLNNTPSPKIIIPRKCSSANLSDIFCFNTFSIFRLFIHK